MVLEAHEAYLSAEQDSQIVKMAPVALEEAKESLEETERLAQKGTTREELEHSVYMTKQRVLIAKQKANLNTAEQAVENAHEERRELLVESRGREADKARKDADLAQHRAEELSKQIEELGARKTDRGVVLTLGDVLFEVNKSELSTAGMRVVNKVNAFLAKYPTYNILVEGHTDSTGSEVYNQALSERRANSVRDALVNRGTSMSRISTEVFGELRPIEDNATHEGRRQNRRVEVVFSDEQGKFIE